MGSKSRLELEDAQVIFNACEVASLGRIAYAVGQILGGELNREEEQVSVWVNDFIGKACASGIGDWNFRQFLLGCRCSDHVTVYTDGFFGSRCDSAKNPAFVAFNMLSKLSSFAGITSFTGIASLTDRGPMRFGRFVNGDFDMDGVCIGDGFLEGRFVGAFSGDQSLGEVAYPLGGDINRRRFEKKDGLAVRAYETVEDFREVNGWRDEMYLALRQILGVDSIPNAA